jgi:hypothetical protein
MTCRALFDRHIPFDAHFVFKAVKAFKNLTNHNSALLQCTNGEFAGRGEQEIAWATKTWIDLPKTILNAVPQLGRERTLLKFIQAAVADLSAPQFDHQQVLDEIKQYIWAATETSALVLAWALYLTSKNPDVAERIRTEGNEVIGDREPIWADYSKLAYSRNAIQETMRMYPPIWSLTRQAELDDTIGGHHIRPGDIVVLCTYAVHHDPRYWNNPEHFDPDRFAPERTKGRPPYSYLPFGAGKRVCIGGSMSQVETVLALSLFLRHFDFEYAGDFPAEVNLTVTLSPRHGLPMRIKRRSRPVTKGSHPNSAPSVKKTYCNHRVEP